MPYTGTGQKLELLTELKNDVTGWVNDWVSQYNSRLEAVPCPYAKQALLRDTVEWDVVSDIHDLTQKILDFTIDEFNDDTHEVLVIGAVTETIGVYELATVIHDLNHRVLMPAGWVALEDHPNDPETVNGESMNHGSWILILIQSLEKLNSASKHLEDMGYYENWSSENLEDVRDWRRKE